MRLKTLMLMSAVLAFGSAAQATEFVTNGDFETSTPAHATPTGVDSYQFGDTYTYGQAVTGWTSTTALGATSGAFNVYFKPDHAAVNSLAGPVSPDTQYTATEPQYLWSVPGGGSPNGGAFVALDGDVLARGILSQKIDGLTIGDKYTLSFDWAAAQFEDRNGDTTEQLEVTFGTDVYDTAVITDLSHQSVGWFTVSHTFTASSTSEVLSFLSIGTPSGFPPVALLDSVSLTGGVPEPASWAMILLGFGGVGATMRARRRRAIATA
jgi:PEP-CTERM motif-containing protein/uncharacterized protein DUF642